MSFLSEEQRQQINAALGNLTGADRRRERARLRSRLLRESEEYRQADNAKKAAHARDRYHANPEAARQRNRDWRQRNKAGTTDGAA